MQNPRGFTLVELAVVVTVLSLIVSIGMANYIRLRDNASAASCVANQRIALHALKLYLVDHPTPAASLNVSDLRPDYMRMGACECPDSGDASYDDYTVTVAGGEAVAVRCDIRSTDHEWTAP